LRYGVPPLGSSPFFRKRGKKRKRKEEEGEESKYSIYFIILVILTFLNTFLMYLDISIFIYIYAYQKIIHIEKSKRQVS
jgi:dolichol kinase